MKVTCPKCDAKQDADRTFCASCHAYLAWGDLELEPDEAGDTGAAPTGAGAPTAVLAPPAPPPPRTASVEAELRVPGAEVTADGRPHAITEAGAAVELHVLLRNVGTLVDALDVSVDVRGIPADWVEIPAPRARLLPPVDRSRARGEPFDVRIVIRPPRSSRATAGGHELQVLVASVAEGGDPLELGAVLTVLPFPAVVASFRPQRVTGRREVTVMGDVRNNGNATFAPIVLGEDAEQECTFAPPADLHAVGPGRTERLRVRVRAPRPLLYGRPRDRQLTFQIGADALPEPTPPQTVIFRQRPLIPWWVPLLLLLALLAGLLLFVLLRSDKVVTPQLEGARSAFVAQRQLRDAGFTSAPKVEQRVEASVLPGTVLDQVPTAGKKVERSSAVLIRVAAQPSTTVVPDLTGYTVAQAEAILVKSRLALGAVTPSKKSNRAVVKQIPVPGVSRTRGTPIDVVLASSPVVRVPDITCVTVAGAERRLKRAGFRLGPVPATVGSKRLSRGQVPAKRSWRRRGTQVLPIFSGNNICGERGKGKSAFKAPAGAASEDDSGFIPPVATTPVAGLAASLRGDVAFDDGSAVRLVGWTRAVGMGREATWSPDGQWLAMHHKAQVVVREAGAGGPEVATVAVSSSDARLPAFSPREERRPLLAFVATSGGQERLCFARVAGGRASDPSCRELGLRDVRALAWRRTGTELLVAGVPSGADAPALLRLGVRSRADAGRASAWRRAGEPVRPLGGGAPRPVLDVAALPQGRIAVVSAIDDRPELVLTRDATLADPRWTGRPACFAAPSPDGRRIALVAPPGPTCVGADSVGSLSVVGSDGGAGTGGLVAARASHPVWRPTAGG